MKAKIFFISKRRIEINKSQHAKNSSLRSQVENRNKNNKRQKHKDLKTKVPKWFIIRKVRGKVTKTQKTDEIRLIRITCGQNNSSHSTKTTWSMQATDTKRKRKTEKENFCSPQGHGLVHSISRSRLGHGFSDCHVFHVHPGLIHLEHLDSNLHESNFLDFLGVDLHGSNLLGLKFHGPNFHSSNLLDPNFFDPFSSAIFGPDVHGGCDVFPSTTNFA